MDNENFFVNVYCVTYLVWHQLVIYADDTLCFGVILEVCVEKVDDGPDLE